jgi:hypothetical protein
LIFEEKTSLVPGVPLQGPLGDLYSTRAAAAYAVEGVRELIEVLKDRGVLDREQADRLQETIIEKSDRCLLEFRLCRDVRAIPFTRDDQ